MKQPVVVLFSFPWGKYSQVPQILWTLLAIKMLSGHVNLQDVSYQLLNYQVPCHVLGHFQALHCI